MIIETYGRGERLKVAASLLSREGIKRRLMLFPIPTTKDGVSVFGTDIPLCDALSDADENTLVVGYGFSEKHLSDMKLKGCEVLDLGSCESFLSENAYITAIGALGYILNDLRCIPQDTVFGVIGYGRIGKNLIRLLLFLGAKVRIYTGRHPARLELGAYGLKTDCVYPSSGKLDLSGVDVLINTAPASVTEKLDDTLGRGIRIIELASGENFKGVEGVVRLPGIPEKMYPESGGRAYFNAVTHYLSGEVVE